MRALNPRRPQPASTFFSRSLLCLPLLLLVLHAGQPRSIHPDKEVRPAAQLPVVENKGDVASLRATKVEGNDAPEQVQGKLSKTQHQELDNEEVVSEEVGTDPEKLSIAGGRSDGQKQNVQVSDRQPGVGKEKAKIDVVQAVRVSEQDSEVLKQEDEEASVVKKRRRNDVALVGKSEVGESGGVPVGQAGEVKDQGIRRFDVRVEGEGVAQGVIDAKRGQTVAHEESARTVESEKSKVPEVDESHVEGEVKGAQGGIPNYFRKSGKIEDEDGKSEEETLSNESSASEESKGFITNREYRSLIESQIKPKRKSSTVYLSAEEKRISDGEQQSIVEGQIKKLISIRDDALGAQKPDETDQAKLLSSKQEVGVDEITVATEEVQGKHVNKVNDIKLTDSKRSSSNGSFLKRWKDQAVSLQEQIRDRTFLLRLKEQATEILPEVPKFTENQLLDALKQIVLSKRLVESNDSFTNDIKDLGLTENQLQIIKCAEQLVAIRERQSFVTNLAECIRGLSILNCMRIFVWPVVVDNLPESVSQNLGNFPIEVNVFDLFQGNRQKSGRSQDVHQIRLLTPDSVVYNILQDALETYPNDETLVSYIDPYNETLKKLLTTDQLTILQMAEKFLPQAVRREYSDKMFSCVRRFEYFSCVKYFAWPLIKQYFPALPAFPDYQSWYPIVDLSPQYPIFPFPSFSEDIGELPEVVDADATRTRKPRPEAIIIQVLQNTLKEQARIPAAPSLLDQSGDTYTTLIPEEQLLTINMAEQLIPISYRPEFIQKTVRCMKEYNYLTCFKYSTWPTVRHFIPTLPDISSLLPDFQAPGLSDINAYVPEIASYPDLRFYWPIGGEPTVQKQADVPSYLTLRSRGNPLQTSEELEIKILEILQKVRNSVDKAREISSFVMTGNALTFTTFSRRQLDILRLAEYLVPSSAREAFITDVLSYLQRNNNFIDCARYVIWPTIGRYVSSLPEFPQQEIVKSRFDADSVQGSPKTKETVANVAETTQERIAPDTNKEKKTNIYFQDKESRNRVSSVPVISVSGTRFVPIFTEHPESVILNILRSVQLQSFKATTGTSSFASKNQQFLDLLTDQQGNIITIVDTLLPERIRPDFANRMVDCLRGNNFLICTRDIVWPTLSEYFPWLPNFPNFGIVASTSTTNSSSATTNQTLTEPSSSSDTTPLSETDVKTGQHGDTTVTITDTRFFPIYNELPETIILNILKAVQLSIPNLPGSPVPARTQDFAGYLTEQQINIVQISENLLPIPTRAEYINKISPCIRERNFLECTRDITWPTIAKSYPWLPSFPNFGTLQNLPQGPESSSIRFQVFLSEKPTTPNLETQISQTNLLKEIEEKIESTLLNVLSKSPELDRSYLNITDPIASILNQKQANIIRLVERGIPDATRPSYVARMLDCVQRYNFIACTNSITWPLLKKSIPLLPDFSSISNLFPQLPGIIQIPDLGQIPGIPGLGQIPGIPDPGQIPGIPGLGQIPGIPDFGSIAGNIPSVSQIPGVSQIAAGISQLPGISQITSGLSQFTTMSPRSTGLPGGVVGLKSQTSQSLPRPESQDIKINGNPTITPSVDSEGIVPGYAGQPPGILLDVSNEKIHVFDSVRKQSKAIGSKSMAEVKTRKRRSTTDVLGSYYDTEEASDSYASAAAATQTFPNFTESEYLQLLIKIKENLRSADPNSSKSKQYLVDTLNSTIRNSLTADQYEILKILEDLDDQSATKGLASQVIQCILGMSFIRCLGIFILPMITSNLPSLGLPSLPSFGILGRSLDTESQVQDFFGMSTTDFEKELLERKDTIESSLLDWYRKLVEDKFQTDVGYFKIKGYGNNEMGISFSGFREGRGAKLKDNKNLPSILTIISDIMEEVLDQRPEGEKAKKDKEKKERSIDESRETDIQFLKNSEEYVDIKRSMNDDEIINMFLDKIRSNDSEVDTDNTKYFTSEDAYNAFEVLFGTKLHDSLENGDPVEPSKEVDIVSLESQKSSDELKSQVAYDFEKESSRDQEERQRQKRAKNFFKSLLEKQSDKYLKQPSVESFEDVEDNKITVEQHEKDPKSSLVIQLPRLHDEIIAKKVTTSMSHLSKDFKTKMTQMMPGFGLVMSFLIQIALAHARAAASMAGMISNIALGSAMFGMVRDTLMGSNSHPKIKYVYDNDKTGPGITWPSHYESDSHYHGY